MFTHKIVRSIAIIKLERVHMQTFHFFNDLYEIEIDFTVDLQSAMQI